MSAKIATSSATEQPQLINGYAEQILLNQSPPFSNEMKLESRTSDAPELDAILVQIAQIFGE